MRPCHNLTIEIGSPSSANTSLHNLGSNLPIRGEGGKVWNTALRRQQRPSIATSRRRRRAKPLRASGASGWKNSPSPEVVRSAAQRGERPRLGPVPMTAAQRQARHRATHRLPEAYRVAPTPRLPPRPRRWAAACEQRGSMLALSLAPEAVGMIPAYTAMLTPCWQPKPFGHQQTGYMTVQPWSVFATAPVRAHKRTPRRVFNRSAKGRIH